MRLALLVLTLLTIYLLVLTSLQPGDVLIGLVVSCLVAAAARRRLGPAGSPSLGARLAATPALVAATLADVAGGTARVARFCLRAGRSGAPGIVEIPVGTRSRSGVAAWGLLNGMSPDEVVVDVDEERAVLVVHVLDASEPAAVRARHAQSYERRQGRVFP